jgi:hypothetical protein
MSSTQPEVRLVTAPLLKSLNALSKAGHCVKVRKRVGSGFGSGGEPDIEGCIDGVCIQIECKAPGNKPTPLQEQRIKEWSDAGALAFWTSDAKDAMRIVMDRLGIKGPMTTQEISDECEMLIRMLEGMK